MGIGARQQQRLSTGPAVSGLLDGRLDPAIVPGTPWAHPVSGAERAPNPGGTPAPRHRSSRHRSRRHGLTDRVAWPGLSSCRSLTGHAKAEGGLGDAEPSYPLSASIRSIIRSRSIGEGSTARTDDAGAGAVADHGTRCRIAGSLLLADLTMLQCWERCRGPVVIDAGGEVTGSGPDHRLLLVAISAGRSGGSWLGLWLVPLLLLLLVVVMTCCEPGVVREVAGKGARCR
ncbi:hypothetical protein SETIT_3G255400v2 [Setaria italica]|uniref:Uncharacterized protein n=1 Tax=Setaria italica TaxID=4555 RepID=A0A368QKT2_SETIT|nr:hypothetical protein SETIT_3G255400v2 [Setaria italica]